MIVYRIISSDLDIHPQRTLCSGAVDRAQPVRERPAIVLK